MKEGILLFSPLEFLQQETFKSRLLAALTSTETEVSQPYFITVTRLLFELRNSG